jgi:AcrR family transcriptional regulator
VSLLNKPIAAPPASAPPSTGRKRRLRKEDILVEATRLFAERGYEGASMGDLAERVGLRKASLFHHFPSKDALYATVLEQLMQGVRAAIEGSARAEGSFVERLDALTAALTATLSARPDAARLLIREAMDSGPVMKEGLGRSAREVMAAALEFARQGQEEGAFAPDLDLRQLIVSLIGVHFMPFAIADIVEGFTGTSPFESPFVVARTEAVRAQTRALVLSRLPPR